MLLRNSFGSGLDVVASVQASKSYGQYGPNPRYFGAVELEYFTVRLGRVPPKRGSSSQICTVQIWIDVTLILSPTSGKIYHGNPSTFGGIAPLPTPFLPNGLALSPSTDVWAASYSFYFLCVL